jgi:hypothetical protein
MKSAKYYQHRLNKVKVLYETIEEYRPILSSYDDGEIDFIVACNEFIKLAVARMLDISLTQLQEPFNNKAVDARMICFYLIKFNCGLTYREISKFYNIDHAHVYQKVKTIEAYIRCKTYPDYLIIVDEVNQALRQTVRPMLNLTNERNKAQFKQAS